MTRTRSRSVSSSGASRTGSRPTRCSPAVFTRASCWRSGRSSAAPPILGGLAGYGIAKATDVDDTDADAIKNQELVEEYRRQAERLQRQKAVRDYTKEVKHTGRVFM